MTDIRTSNRTVGAIISRLPKKDLLTPREIADAFGFVTTQPILDLIEEKRIEAVKVGKSYLVARTAAEAFVMSTEI